MNEAVKFDLVQDFKGMVWDMLLYIPTVAVLASLAAKFWYGDEEYLAYLLYFLTCFFAIVGFNRIFKTRLMLLPSAPISVKIDNQAVALLQKNGAQIDIVKKIRFYADFSGRSFGVSGLNGEGKQLQFVFHKGQFATESQYSAVREALKSVAAVS